MTANQSQPVLPENKSYCPHRVDPQPYNAPSPASHGGYAGHAGHLLAGRNASSSTIHPSRPAHSNSFPSHRARRQHLENLTRDEGDFKETYNPPEAREPSQGLDELHTLVPVHPRFQALPVQLTKRGRLQIHAEQVHRAISKEYCEGRVVLQDG